MAQKRNLKEQLLLLLEENHLLTVEHMLEKLATTHREFNKTSVYRALDQLEETGVVCKQNFGAQQVMYELRDHHHAHLLCMKCGGISVADAAVSPPNDLDGFLIDHHHLTFMGVCVACQAT